MSSAKRNVDLLVLGASFAGIEVLHQLFRRYDGKLRTVVVDRQREHGYIPLVQERLVGRIDPATTMLDTAAYVESLPQTSFVQDEVTAFSPELKQVTLASGKTITARFVVVALGSVLQPPAAIDGHERLVAHKLSSQFDAAQQQLRAVLELESDDTPSIVVAGGGITGVELAGELTHLPRTHGWRTPKVTLLTAGERLVENLPPAVAATVAAVLRAQGVDLRLNTRLRAVEEDAVVVACDGKTESIPCALPFWAGGVRPAPVLDALELPRTEDGWLSVGPSLQCFPTPEPTLHEIFACGDAVRIEGGEGRWPTMQRAIECLWQAKVVARNLVRLAKEKRDYPDGIPPMVPHTLRESFPYGVSLGARSLLVVGKFRTHVPAVTPWFRRFLMRQYFDRYRPVPGPSRA